MSTIDSSADVGAIQQLETLFSSADSAQSGLLSYSEFAYLILKSGGSQEQVDALIDQFSVPSRAQRMVCYAALLQQLRDSVEEEHYSREQSASLPPLANMTDYSPLPVPPPQLQQHQYVATDRSCGPSTAFEHRDAVQSTPSMRNGAYAAVNGGASFSRRQQVGTTSSQPQHSLTHSGIRSTHEDSFAAVTTSTPYRDAALSSSYGRAACDQQQRRPSSPPKREQQPLVDMQRTCSTMAMRADSPRTPLQLSSRFVASALRAAQRQGSTPARRSRSSEGGSSDRRGLNKSESWQHVRSDQRRFPQESSNSAQLLYPQGGTSLSRSRSREDSAARMAHAAKAAQRRCGAGGRDGPATQEDKPRASTESQLDTKTAWLNSTHLGHLDGRKSPRQDTSSFSSSSATGKPALLSLRDVFYCHILRATSAAVAATGSNTVQLSELEDIFAEHGVEVHPLELEAVVDSLELLPENSQNSTRSKTDDDYAGLTQSAVNTSSTTTAGMSTTTVTGGADCALGLVDFCVLVSRLRPAVIQRIRNPTTWLTGGAGHGNVAENCGSLNGKGILRRSMAVFTATGGPPAPAPTTSGPTRNASFTTPQGHSYRRVTDAEGSDEEPSIADVTVSPMTPTTTGGTTPQSHRGSPLHHHQYPNAQPSRPSAAVAKLRRTLAFPQQLLYDTRRRIVADAVDEAPPTARQLSSDRHFSVLDGTEAAPSHMSPLRWEAAEEEQQQQQQQEVWYAQPTKSSQQHRRQQAQLSTSPLSSSSPSRQKKAVLRRTKEPVWHTNPHASCGRSATARSSVHHDASPSSAGSGTARASPSTAPRRVSVSISRSPPSSSSSPTSPAASAGRLRHLSPRLLDTVQRAATSMLLRCTQLDIRHVGCIPRRCWAQVLRSVCPSLDAVDRQKVEEWVEQICRRHTTFRGDLYAGVVEEILTEGARTTAAAVTAAVTPSSDGEPSRLRNAASSQSPATPSSTYSTFTTTTTPTSGRPSHRLSRPTTRVMQRMDTEANLRLRDELLEACGGDTDALQAYFGVFDEAHEGYLHEHVWRASLEELFRRTMSKEAPPWVLEQCYQLSRLPLSSVGTMATTATAAAQPASVAEKAASARARYLPPHHRVALCDYRYVLEELGLAAPLQ
jgi:hypothetical protein